jgi:hypothetical protein
MKMDEFLKLFELLGILAIGTLQGWVCMGVFVVVSLYCLLILLRAICDD